MIDSGQDERSSSSRRESRLEHVLAELMRDVDAGRPVDPRNWLTRYPEFSSELNRFLQGHDHLERMVKPLRSAARSLSVRCPHCQNPVELLEQAVVTDISCPSCGSSFSLIDDDSSRFLPENRRFAHFELVECVGTGQFGSVWKALDTKLDRTVAIKIPRSRYLDSSQAEMFLRDARAAAQLMHPNIARVYEVGKQDGTIYIVSDFIRGVTLKHWVPDGGLSPREAAGLCVKIAAALHHAHRSGVVHRDLKPGNIMMDSDGEPHIVDFGLAKRESGEITMTLDGQILGTPAYMPPEQARGEGHSVDARADVYSLGVVLFELLTRELPFRGDKQMLISQILRDDPPGPCALNRGVPRDLETICLKCLEKEPARRYRDAEQLADDLNRFVAGEPIRARPVSRFERVWRWCGRNPVVAGLSALAAALLLTVASLTTLGYIREARLRWDVQSSYKELRDEQLRSSRLRQDVAGLTGSVEELKALRSRLDEDLATDRGKLAQGEENLYVTYLKLAHSAWHSNNVELADFYLEQCPVRQRKAAWYELRKLSRPDVAIFEGRNCVAVSQDGRMLAAAGPDASIKIWDVGSGKLARTLTGLDQPIQCLDFSPGGDAIAAGGGQNVVLWDLVDGEVRQILEGHTTTVTDIDFSPQGSLASASCFVRWNREGRHYDRKGEVIVWDLETSRPARTLAGVRYSVFNHAGDRLASSRFVDNLRRQATVIWDLSRPADQGRSELVTISNSSVCRPAFHPLRNELAVASGARDAIEFWDVDSGRVVKRFSGEVRVGCLTYSPDGKRLAFMGTTDSFSLRPDTFRAVIWNLITGERERILPWYSSEVIGAAFGRDGQQLVTADGATIKLWDVTPPPDPTAIILNDIQELDVGRHDWPQWGGSRARINTPAGTDIPADWDIGDKVSARRRLEAADRKERLSPHVPVGSKNVKWAMPLGSQTYGNPVVANGKIFLGTNNGAGYLERYPPDVDLGVLLCLDEETGKFLWQHSNEKLPTGRVNDWPLQGVCSTPLVDGDRLWYVSNRGEVVCLDTEGFRDGEDDGPVTDEMVRVFDADLNRLLRDAIPDWFRSHDTPLPANWSPRGGNIEKGWEVRRYDRTREVFETLFELRAEGQRLVVSRIDSKEGAEARTEVFSVDWPLLRVLGRPELVHHFREQWAAAGLTVSRDVEIVTTEQGREWQFRAEARGVTRDCRLRMDGGRISGWMTIANEPDEADVVWKLDMMKELGVSQHNMAACSIITADGMLFVCTSNGLDESHIRLPAPDAPSFLAIDRDTGRVMWTDKSPGRNILHAQWASASYGVFDGRPQVMFPGGDGWVYSFDPRGDGEGGSKLLWKFDGNPKTSKWVLGGRGTRSNIIAFPAIYDGLVYVVMGQDPEHGEGAGHLWCIDPTKRLDGGDISAELAVDLNGNVLPHRREQAVDVSKAERAVPNPQSAVVWHYSYQDRNDDGQIEFEEQFHRSLSIPVIKDDILYIPDFSGLFHCLNAKTGKVYWTYDLLAACWGSALLVDGKVYVGDEDGDVAVFRHSADPGMTLRVEETEGGTRYFPIESQWNGEMLNELHMDDAIYMTPIVANNVLYVATRHTLYAIEQAD